MALGGRGAAGALARAALAAAAALVFAGCSGCGDKKNGAADAAAEASVAPEGGDGGLASADGGSAIDDSAMPAANSEDLQTRMRHVLEALSQNNADLAGDALFPRDGYIATRDTPDPQKAWEKKVQLAFRSSIERTHKRMKGIEQAKFVSFELGHAVIQLTPKKKDFKKPLWRVKHSKLTFSIDGKTRHLDIAEMTAWRGAWYITRLR